MDEINGIISNSQNLFGKNLIETDSMTVSQIEKYIEMSKLYEQLGFSEQSNFFTGHVAAMLFYQSSTRTNMSFQAANARLGVRSIGIFDINSSRSGDAYEESIEDSIKFISQYANLIILRHYDEDVFNKITRSTDIPIINAGSAYADHPTQAIGDIAYISKLFGDIQKPTISIIGSLNLRTARALIGALNIMGVKNLMVTDEGVNFYDKTNMVFSIVTKQEALRKSDVVYITGKYHPDFSVSSDKEKVDQEYILRKSDAVGIKENVVILHPGPKTKDIHPVFDEMPQAHYYKQAKMGMFGRMAVISCILGIKHGRDYNV